MVEFPGSLALDEGDLSASAFRLDMLEVINAIHDIQAFLKQMAGGADSCIPAGTLPGDSFKAKATTPASLRVEIQPGALTAFGSIYVLGSAFLTPVLVAPTVLGRIDLVQANVATREITVKAGDEAATPAAPAADPDCVSLAYITWRTGATSIKDADDSVNAYLTGIRPIQGYFSGGAFEQVTYDTRGRAVSGARLRPAFILSPASLKPLPSGGCSEPALDGTLLRWGAAFTAGQKGQFGFSIPADFKGLRRLTFFSTGSGACEVKFYTRFTGNGEALNGAFNAFGTTLSLTNTSGQQLTTADTSNFAALLGSGAAKANYWCDLQIECVSGALTFLGATLEWA